MCHQQSCLRNRKFIILNTVQHVRNTTETEVTVLYSKKLPNSMDPYSVTTGKIYIMQDMTSPRDDYTDRSSGK
jgi:hypothetical protein